MRADALRELFGLAPPACFACDGSGRRGFMGVAGVPCERCNGSGVDPNPTEEEAHRFANPEVYTLTNGGEE